LISDREQTYDRESLPPESRGQEVRYGSRKAEIISVRLLNERGEETQVFRSGEFATIQTEIRLREDPDVPVTVGFNIKNKYCDIYGSNTRWEGCDLADKKAGDTAIVEFRLRLSLAPETYSLSSGCSLIRSGGEIEFLDRWVDCIVFKVISDKQIGGVVDPEMHIRIQE
jgi:hypothetical protein